MACTAWTLRCGVASTGDITLRVASTEAVNYDLSRGLPTGIFDNVRFIFVQYVRIVLQCKPDVKLSCVILC